MSHATSSPPHKARCHAISRFMRDQHAASAIGYSIVIGLLVAAIVAAAAGLGAFNQQIFNSFAEITNPTMAAGGAASDRPGESSDRTMHPTPTRSGTVNYGAATLAAIAGFSLAIYWWLQRRPANTQSASNHAADGEGDAEAMPSTLQARVFAKRQIIYQILDSNEQLLVENRVEVKHVMTQNVLTVTPDTPMEEVSGKMSELRVRHLLVCQDSKLVGVISDRDLKRIGTRARDVMSPNPETVSPSTPVTRAVTLLMSRGFSCLPVLDGETIVGLLTTTDLMMTLQCTLRLMEQISQQIHGPCDRMLADGPTDEERAA